jgi:hypothetical protein
MTPREAKRLRRTWRRGGLPGSGTTPPVQPTADEASERLVPPPANGWDTTELAAIYPGAGEGWDARNLRREGSRF